MAVSMMMNASARVAPTARAGAAKPARAVAARMPLKAVAGMGMSTLAPKGVMSLKAQNSAFQGSVSALKQTVVAPKADRTSNLVCQAAADAGATEEGGMGKTMVLGGLFAGWYLLNIWFNIYNKQVLKVFAFPVTCTWIQFAVGATFALSMWGLRLHKFPKDAMNKETLSKVAILACVHTLGNLLTNISLGKVAVSFTHTIKAMEPFFSVVLSSIFLGDAPSAAIIASLLPIVGGVALASATEASFNWMGFLSAMGSNLTFQSRNVLSKKFMGGKKPMDNINLFSTITIMSMFLLFPVMLISEGFKFTPAVMSSMGLDPAVVMKRALLAGLCFHGYQQVSYMILAQVSPVTHAVGNCVKRVVVIVASVIFFATPVNKLNAIGTSIALAGVFLYSQVKRMQTKKAAEAVKAA